MFLRVICQLCGKGDIIDPGDDYSGWYSYQVREFLPEELTYQPDYWGWENRVVWICSNCLMAGWKEVETKMRKLLENGVLPIEYGTKECPKCGRRMIKRYEDSILLTHPPQAPWYWWCGCGYREEGGVDRAVTNDEWYKMIWREINKSII